MRIFLLSSLCKDVFITSFPSLSGLPCVTFRPLRFFYFNHIYIFFLFFFVLSIFIFYSRLFPLSYNIVLYGVPSCICSCFCGLYKHHTHAHTCFFQTRSFRHLQLYSISVLLMMIPQLSTWKFCFLNLFWEGCCYIVISIRSLSVLTILLFRLYSIFS